MDKVSRLEYFKTQLGYDGTFIQIDQTGDYSFYIAYKTKDSDFTAGSNMFYIRFSDDHSSYVLEDNRYNITYDLADIKKLLNIDENITFIEFNNKFSKNFVTNTNDIEYKSYLEFLKLFIKPENMIKDDKVNWIGLYRIRPRRSRFYNYYIHVYKNNFEKDERKTIVKLRAEIGEDRVLILSKDESLWYSEPDELFNDEVVKNFLLNIKSFLGDQVKLDGNINDKYDKIIRRFLQNPKYFLKNSAITLY